MGGRLYHREQRQTSRTASAWSLKELVAIRLWNLLWAMFLRWTPKKMNFVRLWALRLFGAKIQGRPFVFPSARIYAPFNLELHDHACIGPLTNIYSLGSVVLMRQSVISQESMLCGGTHDLGNPNLPLLVGDIELGENVFIGARAIVLPGITIGEGAVVGAGSVVTKDVARFMIVAGNPAKVIKKREWQGA